MILIFFNLYISFIQSIKNRNKKIQKKKSRSLPDNYISNESVKFENRKCKTASPGKINSAHKTCLKLFYLVYYVKIFKYSMSQTKIELLSKLLLTLVC